MPPAKKKTTKKKSAAPASGSRGKAAPKKGGPAAASKPETASGSRRGPIYVLIILALLTVILLMLNRFYPGGVMKMKPAGRDVRTAEKVKERTADAGTEKIQIDLDSGSRDDTADLKGGKDAAGAAEFTEARIYFLKFDDKTENVRLAAVKRKISAQTPLEAALKELIKGPSKSEARTGILSAIPQGLRLRSVKIKNRSAELDFNAAIEEGAAGNILLSRVDQIVFTATQFNGVESVIIKINGKTRGTLGSDGLSISGPLKRRR